MKIRLKSPQYPQTLIDVFNIAGDGISVTYVCFHADKCLLYIILITHLIIIHL
jgi:hypothetical protein